jgi:LysM repeat protein
VASRALVHGDLEASSSRLRLSEEGLTFEDAEVRGALRTERDGMLGALAGSGTRVELRPGAEVDLTLRGTARLGDRDEVEATGSARLRGDVAATLRSERGPAPRTPQPSSATYRVRPNDSLWEIATRHGVSLEALRRANGLEGRSLIHPGQVLTIPGARAAEARAAGGPVEGSIGLDDVDLAVDLKRGRWRSDGTVHASLSARGSTRLSAADLRAGRLEAALRGAGTASLHAPEVEVRRAPGAPPTVAASQVSVPVRIELATGTRIRLAGVGEVTVDRPGSNLTLVGRPTPEGLALDDVVLELRTRALMRIPGLDLRGDGTLVVRGRVVASAEGLRLFGSIQAGLANRPGEPLVDVAW